MTLGIVDVGTNSLHLLIGTLRGDGTFRVIVKAHDLIRLGEGGLVRGTLTRRAMHRAMAVLGRYAAILKRHDVDHVDAVATSAVRGATNGRAFVRRVRARLGLPLRVISGREEARLIALGVLPVRRRRQSIAIITIGGGSAQVICGDGARLRDAASVPLGGARLAQRFLHHDPPRPDELEALRRHIERTWSPVIRALRRHRPRRSLGSSATIHQLMMAASLRSHRRALPRRRPLSVSRQALRQLVEWLATSTAAERIRLPGLDPRREDLALPTGVTLLAWMEGCRVSTLRFAPGSIREGLVVDSLRRRRQRIQRIDEPLTERVNA